jgi:hypothetical protein
MHDRYLAASPPDAGEKAATAYRLRLFFLDRWNLWPRLTKYRTWQGPDGETLDGTNNGRQVSEQVWTVDQCAYWPALPKFEQSRLTVKQSNTTA